MATTDTNAPCKPFIIDLEVDPPSGDTEIDFSLEKFCNEDGTEGWKLHFELDEKGSNGTLTQVVKLDIDINDEDRAKAAATAKNGMDENQRAQADVTAQTADSVRTGDATKEDVQAQAGQVMSVRDPNSPS